LAGGSTKKDPGVAQMPSGREGGGGCGLGVGDEAVAEDLALDLTDHLPGDDVLHLHLHHPVHRCGRGATEARGRRSQGWGGMRGFEVSFTVRGAKRGSRGGRRWRGHCLCHIVQVGPRC